MPGTPVVYHAGIAGVPLSGTNYNDNFYLIENAFFNVGAYIISGLVPSIGTGLSVNVSAGVCVLGAYQSVSAFAIAVPANQPIVHLFLNATGTTTANTTGTQPAASVKLGTCVTNATNVTSVNTNRSSGRQLYVRPESQVPGGPGAGNLGSINLANWAAAAADGVPVYGVLPAGATTALTPPVTLTLDDANQNTVVTVLTIGHTYNAGGGAAGIGTALDFLVESSTAGTNKVAASWQATLTNLVPANATSLLSAVLLDNNVAVTPLTVASKDVRISQAPAASSQHGLLSIGSGGFSGNFVGAGSGTFLAINAAAGFTGYLEAIQINGVSRWLVQDNAGFLTGTPPGTANFGLFNLGGLLNTFDGSTGGFFTGSGSGTFLAINGNSGFTGNLVDVQLQGASRFRVTSTGATTIADATTITVTDSGTTNEPNLFDLVHRSSGTPSTSFGTMTRWRAENAAHTVVTQLDLAVGWSTATAGSEATVAIVTLQRAGALTEVMRLNATGNGTLQASADFRHTGVQLGFYNATAIGQQTVSGSRGGNVALADLLLKLANLGLIIDSTSA